MNLTLRRATLISFGFAIAALAVSLAFWSRVPDPMPTDFGLGGHPTGFMPRNAGLLLVPFIMVAVPVLTVLLLGLDPRREHVRRSEPAVGMFLVAVAALMLAIHGLVIAAALRPDMRLNESGLFLALGVFFVLLGNLLPKLRSNFFVGIRTPWTLASERNWHLTHRVGGWSFVLAGLGLIVAALMLPGAWLLWAMVASLVLAGLVPVLYSLVLHLREPAPPADTAT